MPRCVAEVTLEKIAAAVAHLAAVVGAMNPSERMYLILFKNPMQIEGCGVWEGEGGPTDLLIKRMALIHYALQGVLVFCARLGAPAGRRH